MVTYLIIGVIVLAVVAAAAFRPLMRSLKLKALDQATGAEAIARADDYLAFEDNSEALVREAIQDNRGPFAAQVHLAKAVGSFPALISIAERPELSVEQRATALLAAASVFSSKRHAQDRIPKELATWTQDQDRALALAAMAVLVKHGGTNPDPDTPVLLARIAAQPGQDPLRVSAALDGLAEIIDESSLGQAIELLHSGASAQVLAHAGLTGIIRSRSRPSHLGALVGLLDHRDPEVRALGLETLGGLTMPDSADPQMREQLGQRIAAKLLPATPAVELAAALKATAGLRLTGAREAVLALLPQRAQLALPGLDEAWWANCLGRALILTQPPAARPASEDLIAKLTTALADPATRPVAAKALSLVSDREFRHLRLALDALAEQGTDPTCLAALITVVTKTYDRSDVASAYAQDLTRWRAFLAEDRPRSARVAEIRAYVDAHQDMVRASVGHAKLKATQQALEAATADLQGWLDDKRFIPPLGLTSAGLERLFHDLKTLHFSVMKAMPSGD